MIEASRYDATLLPIAEANSMTRAITFSLLAALLVMSLNSTSFAGDPLGPMQAPGWQTSSPADLTESPEAMQELRDRLRNLARRSEIKIERDVVYATRGDKQLLMDIYVPEGDGPHSAVMVVHGGAWRSGSKAQLMPYARQLAERGHVAFAINYRLAPDDLFPAQIEDCQDAVRFMYDNAAKYNVDHGRMGAIGYSAGGHLVALLGAQGIQLGTAEMPPQDDNSQDGNSKDGAQPEVGEPKLLRLKAVAPGGAPCDFREIPAVAQGLAYWLGGSRREKGEIYKEASPAAFVTKDACPMFFFHGEQDELVNLANPKAMMADLKQAGVETDMFVVPGAGHIAAALNQEALTAALDFLDAHLKPEKPAENAAAAADGK